MFAWLSIKTDMQRAGRPVSISADCLEGWKLTKPRAKSYIAWVLDNELHINLHHVPMHAHACMDPSPAKRQS